MGLEGIQVLACCSNFQPHVKEQQVINLGQIYFSESEISHVSSSYLLKGCEDTFCRFLEQPSQVIRQDIVHGGPRSHALEYVDQPFQMKGCSMKTLLGARMNHLSHIAAPFSIG
jgi:hypothetical protein